MTDANPLAELYIQNLLYSNVGGSSHTDFYLTVFADFNMAKFSLPICFKNSGKSSFNLPKSFIYNLRNMYIYMYLNFQFTILQQ